MNAGHPRRRRGPPQPQAAQGQPGPKRGPARPRSRRGWPLFEVVVRGKRGLNHVHVGSLRAADERMALAGTANLTRAGVLDFHGSIRPILEALEEEVILLKLIGSAGEESEVRVVRFRGPFKPSSEYKIELPSNLIDESGRALSNASRFPMTMATDAYPPLAKFSARFGILESADSVLPVTMRNLEAQIRGSRLKVAGGAASGVIGKVEAALWRVPAPDAKSVLDWLRKVAAARRTESVFAGAGASGAREFSLPKPNGPSAFEVVGIPLKRSGLYVVELKSTRLGADLLGENQPMYVPTAALGTNLSVHFKKGHDNSLVWVTTLERAEAVAGAHVAIADCNGTELWRGTTDRRGLALVPELPALIDVPRCRGAEPDYS